ncbi:hypothetical protein F4778DRAFT_319328 [Xylariomycetidae sp. FL2044]|nr:hypothetical protein F4778DRAFT_319328 [Xylariomycetidae sp. FL2044]
MSNAFRWSDLSSSPSTPERSSKKPTFAFNADHPSTTPAGPPPPSSAPSFTPVGDPSPSFLKSSIGAMTGNVKPPNFGRPSLRSSAKSSSKPSSGIGSNVPLGRSIRASASRQPSSLSREYHGEDEDDDEDDEPPANPSGTFAIPYDDTTEGEDTELDHEDAQDEDEDEDEVDEVAEIDDQVEAMVEDDVEYDIEEDLLREIAETAPDEEPLVDDESDLMMLATPAADARIRRDAENIFRASSMRSTLARKRDFRYSTLAKDLYTQSQFAPVSEPDAVILKTEDIVNRLYDEGVGPEDDEERLDNTLSQACVRLMNEVWIPHLESLPGVHEEHAARVGPDPTAPPFEKALCLAILVFQIHHSPPNQDQFGGLRKPQLPATLFNWLEDEHNPDRDQLDIILDHRPSPAAHGLYWQAVYNTLIRGNVAGATHLLRGAGWDIVKKSPRGEALYSGQALTNIKRVVEDLCQTMELCPSTSDNWDIRSSDWTLFRLKAKAARENLISFAEGKDRASLSSSRYNNSAAGNHSLTGLARKAESQIPWDVYENLQSLYAILEGKPDAILSASQDWCEATIGLYGWWDDGHSRRSIAGPHSRSLIASQPSSDDDLDRLSLCLQTTIESNFHFNSADAVEMAIACAFEGNVEGVIGFLRLWSLPIASTVAEIASLGRWLPPAEPQNLIDMDEFDMEDLEVLGMQQSAGPEDKDGIKDTTLIHYARGLRSRKNITGTLHRGQVSREGWEMAIQVVGRMDSPERSEQMVQELLQDVISTIGAESRATVDKIWRLLNELGMINFAEDTAETFGDILAKDTFRFGEALWYYALAHRPGKVRDVLNTLMSISLVESTTYPPEKDLDETLRDLLKDRTSALEIFAKQDLEAAELLGKMLSGYATLRKFYELRDGNGSSNPKSLIRRQQAASALVPVIASADDNIRGGLYDDTRDAVVSEDFLLPLLGEASVFVGQSPAVLTLDQIDTLFKAIEDIQTVGTRVYEASDEFFKLVLASGNGKGSTPASLLSRSTSSLGGSFVMTGSSMMASQLHQSVVKSGMIKGQVKRTWDWRTSVYANSSSTEVLKNIRLGLARDLADLWLEQADSVIL